MRRKFLVVSASMGAGHDGVARELVRRLESQGHEATLVDFLDAFPLGTGRLLARLYAFQLRYAPFTYQIVYRLWHLFPFMWGPLALADSLLAGRTMRRWVARTEPDAVVSTYPLASLVLGHLRRRGLEVPVVTFLTDFGVHPLWVHPAVDVHLAVHPASAECAARRSGGPALAPGPVVAERFRCAGRSREEARRRLGLGPDERAVLVVAGSWGVGDVEGTVELLGASGRYTPIAVCGADARLRRRLERRGRGIVMGWTDDMPTLMAAADALVENAGGLTCMEAFAAGLPVVSFRPIAGHGRENAEAMAAAGVSRLARSGGELLAALDEVTVPGPARSRLLDAAGAMFSGDAAAEVVAVAGARGPEPVVVPARRRVRLRTRLAAGVAAAYAFLTLGVGTATAHGLGVARAAPAAGSAVYVGVRVNGAELQDAATRDAIRRLPVTVVVDARTARAHPRELQQLVDAGVDIANGGWGRGSALAWRRARNDLSRAGSRLNAELGVRPREFMPERRIDAFDLMWSRRVHQRCIRPDQIVRPDAVPQDIEPRRIYVLDGTHSGPEELRRSLRAFQDAATRDGLASASFAALR